MPTVVGCALDLSSFMPSCEALTSPGGVQPFHYFGRKADLLFTYATDGTITAITLKTGGKLAKGQGRKFQNSATYEAGKSATGKTLFKQAFNDRIYHDTQAERNALKQLALVEDLVIISPDNTNKFEVYGAGLGLSPASGKGGTGTKLDDDNTMLFSFEGQEPSLPAIFNTVTTTPGADKAADFAANVAYLDGLVNA